MDNGYCPMAAPFNDGAWYDPEDGLLSCGTCRAGFTVRRWQRVGMASTGSVRISMLCAVQNLVWPNRDGYDRDGCLVWLDHEAESSEKRFKDVSVLSV